MRWWKSGPLICTFVLAGIAGLTTSMAETYKSIQLRKPDLFHPQSGLRIEQQRAPVSDDIPSPAKRVDVEQVAKLQDEGAVLLDVFGALQSRYDELDGTWLVGTPRQSIPGAVWMPEVGRGVLTPEIDAYLTGNLEELTGGDKSVPIVTFCVSDCWMSWNAAQRIARFGYTNVNWFPTGTDGWLESGRKLAQLDPVPVDVD